MILFTSCGFLQMNSYDGDGRKTPKYIQKQRKNPRLVALPSPPVYKIGGRLFSGAKAPETSRTCPRWDWDPNLLGKKRNKGSGRYGSIQAGNMIFIHMNVQDLQ